MHFLIPTVWPMNITKKCIIDLQKIFRNSRAREGLAIFFYFSPKYYS